MTAKKKEETKNDAVLPEKRAEISHTDQGYMVLSVDGDAPVVEERYQRLEGLFQRVEDLKKAGYKVSLEGPLPKEFKPV